MNRIWVFRTLYILLLTSAMAWAYIQPGSGIDSITPVGDLTQRQLFCWVFQTPSATVDSARKWYAHHSGVSYSAVTDSVLIEEILGDVRGRLRSLEQKYLEAQVALPTPTF